MTENRRVIRLGGDLGGSYAHPQVIALSGMTNIGIAGDIQADTVRVLGGATDETFTSAGHVAIKHLSENPLLTFHRNNGARAGYIWFNGTSGIHIVDESNLPIQLSTNGTERMRITNAGLVGIDTDAPDKLLTLRGTTPTLKIHDDTPGNGLTITHNADASAQISLESAGLLTIGAINNNAASEISFNTRGTERMRIKQGGNIGIGTDSPSAKLAVNGAVSLVDGMSAPTATSGWAAIFVDSSDGDLKVRFGDGITKTLATDS